MAIVCHQAQITSALYILIYSDWSIWKLNEKKEDNIDQVLGSNNYQMNFPDMEEQGRKQRFNLLNTNVKCMHLIIVKFCIILQTLKKLKKKKAQAQLTKTGP